MALPEMGPGDSLLKQAFGDPELLRSLLDEIDDGLYVVDRERRIAYWNHGAERITGYLTQDVTGRLCEADLLMHCDEEGAPLCGKACPLRQVMDSGHASSATVYLRHRHGHRIPVRVQAHAVHGPDGRIAGALEVFERANLTARPELFALEGHGGGDRTTGAANRAYGEMKLEYALAEMDRFGTPTGWIGVELDGVKDLDHRFGQRFIDSAMNMMARTLEANVGAYDVVTRWERCGFRVLIQGCSSEGAAQLARRLAALIKASNVEWWGDPLSVTASAAATLVRPKEGMESVEARVRQALAARRESAGDGGRREGDAGRWGVG
ncbi:MAG: diguanylate cyclase [Bryobacteraceae bacterium]|nr:diguanylate cyclase [Bryobacteraceae bacterium]